MKKWDNKNVSKILSFVSHTTRKNYRQTGRTSCVPTDASMNCNQIDKMQGRTADSTGEQVIASDSESKWNLTLLASYSDEMQLCSMESKIKWNLQGSTSNNDFAQTRKNVAPTTMTSRSFKTGTWSTLLMTNLQPFLDLRTNIRKVVPANDLSFFNLTYPHQCINSITKDNSNRKH